jgi:pimeloyl-ACP methyl ester carboxylesterase
VTGRAARAVRVVRNQLGSIRRGYLGGDLADRRDDFGEGGPVVLLINGFFQSRNIWTVMEARLRADGYRVMSFHTGGLWSRFDSHPVETLAERIAAKVERLAERHGFHRLHVVGHSRGGLVARRWVVAHGGASRVASVVTLGTPHHGTPTALLALPLVLAGVHPRSLRELLPRSPLVRGLREEGFPAGVPLTSVWSADDVICPWWCARLHPSAAESHVGNVEVPGVGHSELVWHPGVYAIVRDRLRSVPAPA